jgi:hypothetical protein
MLRNLIVRSNSLPAIDATCAVSSSVIDPGYAGPGLGNQDLDPMFLDVANADFRLSTSSPARGLADPASLISYDVDGERRPEPAGTPPDPGADEVP